MSEPGKPPTEQDVSEYMNVLLDAARMRSSNEEVDRCKSLATCMQEIYNLFKKYNVNTTDEIIHILVGIMVIPVQMLEPDPLERASLMKQLAIAFTKEIMGVQLRDVSLKGSESGNELDRLRNMVKDSEIFET